MIEFWLLIAILIAIACGFILPPLWRKPKAKETDSSQLNIDIARLRLADLKSQLTADVIDENQYNEQYQELQLILADDLSIAQTQGKQPASGRWLIIIFFIALPLFSISMYLGLGKPEAITAVNNIQMEQIDAMIAQLADRLQAQPEDAQGWLMLGRSYKFKQQFDQAAYAYGKAYAILGDQVDVLLHYADALAMANDGRLAGRPQKLIAKALELAPNDATGLWLAGMAAAEAGQYADAKAMWQKLAAQLPENSDSLRQVQGLIGKVSEQMTPAENTGQNSAGSAQVSVRVTIAPELKAKAAPADTVFIYAQAMDGPPMPLAIVKKQAQDLPVVVILNDQLAMMPAMKLSNFDKVKVSARISKSGQAEPQPGDLFGVISQVSTAKTDTVDLNISQEIK